MKSKSAPASKGVTRDDLAASFFQRVVSTGIYMLDPSFLYLKGSAVHTNMKIGYGMDPSLFPLGNVLGSKSNAAVLNQARAILKEHLFGDPGSSTLYMEKTCPGEGDGRKLMKAAKELDAAYAKSLREKERAKKAKAAAKKARVK